MKNLHITEYHKLYLSIFLVFKQFFRVIAPFAFENININSKCKAILILIFTFPHTSIINGYIKMVRVYFFKFTIFRIPSTEHDLN